MILWGLTSCPKKLYSCIICKIIYKYAITFSLCIYLQNVIHIDSDCDIGSDLSSAGKASLYTPQAILVHPDKTQHQGADAAFKILVQAFEAIGDPDKRKVKQ